MASETVSVEKFYQDELGVIQGSSVKPAAVDAWEAAVRAYIQHFNGRNERYLIYDLLQVENLAFTSYMRQRATALAEDNRDASGRIAIVLEMNPLLRHLFALFLRLTGSRIQPNLDVRLFDNREDALQWVASALPEALQSAGS